MSSPRFSLEPLLALLPSEQTARAEKLRLSYRNWLRWIAAGDLSERQADRAAAALGLHPWLIWPDLEARQLEDFQAAEERRLERRREIRRASYRRRAEATRERRNAKRRAFYAENRDYERRREQARYWADPDRHRARMRENYARRKGQDAA